jgi:alcohol dehydrogenase class IV
VIPIADAYEFDYFGTDIVYGRGSVADLETHLADAGLDRALVVCGRNVGSNEALMSQVRSGLGDALVGVFDETTPDKLADTVADGIETMHDLDPDVLVGLGGGSSLDVARQLSAFEADGRPISAYREAARDGRTAPPDPDQGDLTAVAQLPTTFAGADMSSGGSIEILTASDSPTGQPIRWNHSVWPHLILFDPGLFETTPMGALAGSAMNGFNKGVETPYARTANPITDATAIHGLRLLRDGYVNLGEDPAAMDRAVQGIILAQFKRNTSVVHAFGHGFSHRYTVQQGDVHAIVVPHVLRYLFGKIDAGREKLAAAFDLDPAAHTDDELGEAIIEEVEAVRDSFDLPTQLRDLDPVDPDDFPAIAEFILDDHLMPNAPADLEPTADEIEAVLEQAW